MQPHRRKPTRLPHPWDSPGKNTGVGCHFLLQCMKVKSEREVTQSCPTLSNPMDCSLTGSSVHGIFQARVLEGGAIAFSLTDPTFFKTSALLVNWVFPLASAFLGGSISASESVMWVRILALLVEKFALGITSFLWASVPPCVRWK